MDTIGGSGAAEGTGGCWRELGPGGGVGGGFRNPGADAIDKGGRGSRFRDQWWSKIETGA